MPANRPAAEPSKWRFSLRSLFLLMLLASVVVWLTSWRMWDLDERIVLGSWFIAVIGAISWSRLRGRRGILLSTLVGGLVPPPLITAYYIWSDFLPFDYVPTNGFFVAFAGAFAGGMLAWLFTPGGLDQLPPSQREDRQQRRLVAFAGTTTLLVLAVGIWSACLRAKDWKLRGEFWPHQFVSDRGDYDVELSNDGSRLLYVAPLYGERDKGFMVVWDLLPPRNKPVFERVMPNSQSWNWSHDGELIAICVIDDGQATISILESANGRARTELKLPAKLSDSDAGSFSFSLDDRLFRFVTRLESREVDATRSYRWRTDNWHELAAHEGDGNSKWPAPSQDPPVRIIDQQEFPWDPETYRIEIGKPESPLGVRSYGPFEKYGPVTFIPGANQVAFGSSLIDLPTGAVRNLPGFVDATTRDGKRLLCVERNDRQGSRTDFNDGPLPAVPIIQHLWLDGMHVRFVLLNAEDCRALSTSQWMRIEWGLADVSADGKLAVVKRGDWFKVLEIPD